MLVATPIEYSFSQSHLTINFFTCPDESTNLLMNKDSLIKALKNMDFKKVEKLTEGFSEYEKKTDVMNILSKNKNVELVPPMSPAWQNYGDNVVSFKTTNVNPVTLFLNEVVSKGHCLFFDGFLHLNAEYYGNSKEFVKTCNMKSLHLESEYFEFCRAESDNTPTTEEYTFCRAKD